MKKLSSILKEISQDQDFIIGGVDYKLSEVTFDEKDLDIVFKSEELFYPAHCHSGSIQEADFSATAYTGWIDGTHVFIVVKSKE